MDNEMNMGGTPWYMKKGVLGVVVLVVVIILGVVLFGGGNGSGSEEEVVGGASQVETSATDPRDGETAVVGKLACMPLKSGVAPTSEECVLGLQGDDGKFYAMDTSKIEIAGKGIAPDAKIKLVGVFTKVASGSEEASVFAYDGVMVVRAMVVSQ